MKYTIESMVKQESDEGNFMRYLSPRKLEYLNIMVLNSRTYGNHTSKLKMLPIFLLRLITNLARHENDCLRMLSLGV